MLNCNYFKNNTWLQQTILSPTINVVTPEINSAPIFSDANKLINLAPLTSETCYNNKLFL